MQNGGSAWTTEDSSREFAVFYTCFSVFFWSFYLSSNEFFTQFSFFKEKSKNDKEEFRALFTGLLHHIIISVYGIYTFAIVCTDADVLPVNDSDWKFFRYIDSETCYRMPNQMYGNMIMISTAYLTWDIIKHLVFMETWTRAYRENFYHHIVSFLGINGALICGFGGPSIAALLLLTEISSIFLSARNLIERKYHSECWFQPLILCFFVSFTVFRILLAPFSLKNTYDDTIMNWERRNGFLNVIMLITFGMGIVLTAMNIYWYYFIIRMVFKPFLKVEMTKEEKN